MNKKMNDKSRLMGVSRNIWMAFMDKESRLFCVASGDKRAQKNSDIILAP
jgi:hypothetical protein